MANTTYQDVYLVFLMDIKAYDLMGLSVDIKEDIMTSYLEKSATKFSSCNNMKKINKENKCFDVELEDDEISTLAALMVLCWLKPFLLSDEALQTHLTTKEYGEASQNKLIEQIRETYKMARSEARQLVNIYDHKHHKISEINKSK